MNVDPIVLQRIEVMQQMLCVDDDSVAEDALCLGAMLDASGQDLHLFAVGENVCVSR